MTGEQCTTYVFTNLSCRYWSQVAEKVFHEKMEALFVIRMGCIVSSCDGNIIPYVTKHRSFNHSYLTHSSTKIGSQCKPFYHGLKTWSILKLFHTIKLIIFLTFTWPCIINVFFKYNQQDATLYNILYYCQCSTCFRRFLRPSSGAKELYTQHRVYAKLACCYP